VSQPHPRLISLPWLPADLLNQRQEDWHALLQICVKGRCRAPCSKWAAPEQLLSRWAAIPPFALLKRRTKASAADAMLGVLALLLCSSAAEGPERTTLWLAACCPTCCSISQHSPDQVWIQQESVKKGHLKPNNFFLSLTERITDP